MKLRAILIVAAIAAGVLIPLGLSDFMRALAANAAIAGLLVLSLVLLTGYTGQISFSQYSFAAVGAFSVGSLMAHGWSFWAAAPLGVVFAALVGMLVAIPALRLSGLFLAILTVAVALFFDRFLLAPGTWDSFSGGVSPWRPSRPHLFGIGLDGSYVFYLFTFAVLIGVTLLIWNLRVGKSGRVLRAIRDSEVAAQTIGYDLTLWKLGAFGLSAAICGVAGALQAVAIGSVSPPSYDFTHSIQIAAVATVFGVGSITAAFVGGIFFVFFPEILRHTPLQARVFPLILGALLIFQLVFAPEGAVARWQADIRRVMRKRGMNTRITVDSPTVEPEAAEVA
ncbi:MAG: branched-chain amino acid ABC transporter permease [Actinomycetota bacterium]